MGHEFCAEIVDYGPDTQHSLASGTRVCAMPVMIRGTSLETIGYSNNHPGGYGEYMRSAAPLITGKVGVEAVAAAFAALASLDTHANILVEPWHV